MRRLSYAPKAYVYIHSSNLGKVIDVSDDVVSGQVQRVLNGTSSAEVVLRNRFKKYIREADSGASVFLPMDMISIWLQRIAGKPIRVFTGYLDSAPYYQGYPGNCTMTATCTLKRLSYQWFDPGLEFFSEWLQKTTGWFINRKTGSVTNLDAYLKQANPSTPVDQSHINDGSFGQLLFDFMTQVAGWDKDMVLVSDIDPSIPKRAAQLYQNVELQAQHDLDTLANYLGAIMGLSVNDSANSTGFTTAKETITRKVKKQADAFNLPLLVPVTAGLLTSNYVPTYSNENTKDKNWGFGLYALRPPMSNPNDKNSGRGILGDKVEGYTLKQLQDPGTSTRAFAKKLMRVNATTGSSTGEDVRNGKTSYLNRAAQGDSNAIRAWIEAALGRNFKAQDFADAINLAGQYVSAWNTDNPQQVSNVLPTPVTTHQHITWSSNEIKNYLTGVESTVYTKQYTGHVYDSLAPYYYRAKKMYSGISLGPRGLTAGGNPLAGNFSALVLVPTTSNSSQLQQFFAGLKKSPEIQQITWNGNQPEAWRKGVQVAATNLPKGEFGPSNSVVILQAKNAPYPTWAGSVVTKTVNPSTNTSNDPTAKNINGGKPLTMEQLGTLSLDSAFLAQFTFPTNMIESQSLTGNRALLNDIPCIDAVHQFCQASLRAFCSLPDGSFLAFYPDYFGARRKPYWAIRDIEIVNFGIQLNDQQLATHVYVVGDTFGGAGLPGEANWINEINTAGVATIAQAFILDSFIVPEKAQRETAWGRLRTAYEFLQHYGARPLTIQAPYIKNSLYEFLMAWQVFMQKWASQFATSVEFTFQPEVLAGGLIAFPDHDVQMFCESVTHSWDYTSGFQTQAVLSSPAVMSKKAAGQYPGMALAGGVNSVGLGAGGS
jgi:hypothetical protein